MQERPNSERIETETEREANAQMGLEELFAEAEALIERLEDPDLPLEEAFAAYEKGMKVIRLCNSRIDLVEEKMMMVNEEGELTPFEPQQS